MKGRRSALEVQLDAWGHEAMAWLAQQTVKHQERSRAAKLGWTTRRRRARDGASRPS